VALVQFLSVVEYFKGPNHGQKTAESFYIMATWHSYLSAAAGVTDSPVGLAAYMTEKYYSWTDPSLISQAMASPPISQQDILTQVGENNSATCNSWDGRIGWNISFKSRCHPIGQVAFHLIL